MQQAGKVKLLVVGLIFSFSIGFSFYGIKQCTQYADTLTILAYRYTAALLGVAIWTLVAKALGYPAPKLKHADDNRPRIHLHQNTAFYILFMIFQILAMFFATSIEGAIVYSMVPIFAKLIGRIVLGERSTKLQLFFIIITVTALLLLIICNATNIDMNVVGLLIMLVSCVFMSCQTVVSRYVRGVFKPIEITTNIAIFGAIIFVGISIVRAIATHDFATLLEPLKHVDFIIWASFLGVFCILLSAQLMAYMLAHMEIIQSSAFNSISTLISIIAGALLLHEPLYWYHYVCGIVIIVCVAGLMIAPSKEENAGKSLSDDI